MIFSVEGKKGIILSSNQQQGVPAPNRLGIWNHFSRQQKPDKWWTHKFFTYIFGGVFGFFFFFTKDYSVFYETLQLNNSMTLIPPHLCLLASWVPTIFCVMSCMLPITNKLILHKPYIFLLHKCLHICQRPTLQWLRKTQLPKTS